LITGLVRFVYDFSKDVLRIFILKIEPINSDAWNDNSIPEAVKNEVCNNYLCAGIFYKLNIDQSFIDKLGTLEDLENLLIKNEFVNTPLGNKDDIESIGFNGKLKIVLLIDNDNNPNVFAFLNLNNNEKLIRISSIRSERDTGDGRIPEECKALNEKSVGIVGLGSVGSKVAISLARMGISSFYLIDDDVFLPENICRNALNWRNVGEHKVDAVSGELELINPCVNVNVSKLNIAEQESSSALNSVLNKLGKYDIIVDATGNSKAFNVLASVSKNYKKPLVWCKVYEGGIGGLIARSRPDFDPEPLLMRAIYHSATLSAPKFDSKVVKNYETEDDYGNLISASDAQVSIIAYELVHLAIDTLLYIQQSNFSHSMYLVGLKKSWIFNEPFDTRPIQTNNLEKNIKVSPKKATIEDHKRFILEAIKNGENENNTPK